MALNQYDELVQQVDEEPAPANPYTDLLRREDAGRQTQLRVAQQAAQDTTPDRAAEAQRLSERTGLPTDLVLRNFEDIQKRAKIADTPYAQMVRETPALASWLTDPHNAAVSSDDLPALSGVARLLGVGRNVAGAGAAGLVDFLQGAYGAVQAGAEAVGAPRVAAESASKAEQAGALATRLRGPQAGAGFIERSIYGGIESLGQMAPALVTGAISGAVALLAEVGLTTAGQTYAQARQQGQTPGKSLAAGAIQGAVEVGTEFLPAHRLLGDLAAKSGLLKTLAHQIAPEIVGEEIATALQDLNEWAFLPANKDRTFADYLRERPSQAAATAISTITAVGATTVAAHGTSRFIEQLGEQLTESKTAKRSPEAVHDLIAQATHDGPAETVYAPIDTFTTYWQSKGIDPRQMATALTGDAAAFDRAVATGQDLSIPTATYAVQLAATEHNAFFANELRLSPEQMNAREATEFEQRLASQPESLSPEPVASSAQPVRDNIVQQLTAAGVEPAAADAQAQLYESVFQNLGERAGVGPVALFNRYGLQIGRPELDTITSPAQTVGDATAAGLPSERVGREGSVAVHGYQASAPRVYPDERTRQHFENLLADLAEHARALDPAVTAEDLRPEFESRLSALDDIQHAAKESGHDPQELLRTIAKYGGLGPESAGGLTGELRALKEGLRFGAVHGVQRVFRATQTLDDRGAPKTGLGFDVMLQKLQQDPRFAWIENVDMLIDELDNAIRNPLPSDALPTVKDLAKALGMSPDKSWWKSAAPAVEDEGDISFDPTEFNQGPKPAAPLFDTLYTGEQQARLPEAGAVRDIEQPAPEFDLPFSLTAPVTKSAKEKQSSLFQGNRGAIRFGSNRQFRIDLLEGADLSTFLHESSHFFLEVMTDLAAESPQIAGDLATLHEWFGSDTIGADQHEQFARGFEAYLLEGAAPSSALRSVFGRFRAWLVGVYRTVSSLNVTLNDDVRRVFDRLVASDEAIEQAEQEGRISPLFTDPASAGMTPEQFEAYRATVQTASVEARDTLQRKVLRELQREQKAWWSAERETMRASVAAEIHQEPVYRALAAIRKGTHPDGTSLVEGDAPVPMKLAKADLVDRYTAEQLKSLRDRQLYAVEDGVSPDTVAEFFGFTSGDELVQALIAAPGMNATIDQVTDAQMREKFGDLLLDGRLSEQAQQAVFGEGRQQVIHAELKALTAGLSKGVIPPASVLKAAAERRIAEQRVRDIRPGLFLMAAQRASQRAFDLLATNTDRVGAVNAKQQELFSLALYREANRVKDDVDARIAWVKKQDTDKGRQRMGKAGADYLDQWDGFLDRYEFKRVSQKLLDRRTSLANWITAQEAQGLPVDLPASVLNDSRQVNYQTLSVEEFQGVTDAMKSIAHLARLKSKLLTAADKRSFEDAIGDVVGSIHEHKASTPLPLEFLPKDLKARKVAEWFASHTKIATIARAMDGYADGGAVWERVIRPINEAATREATMNSEATHALHALMTTAYTGRELGKLHDTSFIPAIGASLSNEARLMVAMNWGNEGNRQRLRDGRSWNDQQIRAILDTLDARDWAFVQGVWDFIDTYWPAIAEKQKRVTGIAPAKVEASPVQTRFGEFAGGYFPLAYDGRLSARSGSFIEANEAGLQKQAAYVKATTRRGHTEARAARNTEPVRLELSVLYGHVEQVIHDLSHHEMLIDVGRVLGDKRVQQAVYETHGDLVYQQFKNALKDIAYGVRPAADSIEKALNFVRQGTTVAGLAWNVWTAVQQPAGVFNGMARVGPSWVMKGMRHMLRDAASMENTAAWIYARSDMMKVRGSTQQREISELRNTVTHPGGWFDNALRTVTLDHLKQQDIADSYFGLIEIAQKLADMPTWIGAYEKAMAGGEEESRAVALADQAVLDSQGGGQIKDLAQAQRGGAAVKLFTNFYSYGNLLYNSTAEQYGKTNFRRAGSVGQFLQNLTLLYIFPAATSIALARAFGRDDGEDGFLWSMGKEIVGQALNTMVLVREFGGLLRAGNRGYDGPTGTRLFAGVSNLVTQAEQGDLDRGLLRSTEDVAGILFKLPLAQVQRSVDGFVALQEGKTSNPLALVAGAPKERR